MKKLTLITVLLLAFSVSGSSQKKVDNSISSRFACPNVARDTLFVVKEMFPTMKTLWTDPNYSKDKPVIVSVKVLDPNVLKSHLKK